MADDEVVGVEIDGEFVKFEDMTEEQLDTLDIAIFREQLAREPEADSDQ
jgi:hypothetical protein